VFLQARDERNPSEDTAPNDDNLSALTHLRRSLTVAAVVDGKALFEYSFQSEGVSDGYNLTPP